MAFTKLPNSLDSIAVARYENKRWNTGLWAPNPGHPLAAINSFLTFCALVTSNPNKVFDWAILVAWPIYQRINASAAQTFSLNNTTGELWQNGEQLLQWNPALDFVLFGAVSASAGLWTASPGNYVAVVNPLDLTQTYSVTGATTITAAHVYREINTARTAIGAASTITPLASNPGTHYAAIFSKWQ